MKAVKSRAIGAGEQDLKALPRSALEGDEKKQDGHAEEKKKKKAQPRAVEALKKKEEKKTHDLK